MKELFVIFEEYSAGLTWEQWLKLYRHATAEKYHFMFLDLLGPDELKIRKDFDKVLRIDAGEE
jgi:hypothetical protein